MKFSIEHSSESPTLCSSISDEEWENMKKTLSRQIGPHSFQVGARYAAELSYAAKTAGVNANTFAVVMAVN